MEILLYIVLIVLYIVIFVQMILAYGTAYRATKRGGDNGVALFGWIIVYGLAAVIPGLGFYLWSKSKKKPNTEDDEDI